MSLQYVHIHRTETIIIKIFEFTKRSLFVFHDMLLFLCFMYYVQWYNVHESLMYIIYRNICVKTRRPFNIFPFFLRPIFYLFFFKHFIFAFIVTTAGTTITPVFIQMSILYLFIIYKVKRNLLFGHPSFDGREGGGEWGCKSFNSNSASETGWKKIK